MHRAGQRCFELLALIGSPQLSRWLPMRAKSSKQRCPALNKACINCLEAKYSVCNTNLWLTWRLRISVASQRRYLLRRNMSLHLPAPLPITAELISKSDRKLKTSNHKTKLGLSTVIFVGSLSKTIITNVWCNLWVARLLFSRLS